MLYYIYKHSDDTLAFDVQFVSCFGELKDELNGAKIVSFASAGSKNYSYRTSNGISVLKVRGFTLDPQTSKLNDFNKMKSIVTENQKECDNAGLSGEIKET